MKQQIKILFASLLMLTAMNGFGQTNKIKQQADSLKYVKGDVFECSSLTWKIIACKKDAIQILIDKLDDTTMTKATYKCKPAGLHVGDIAYLTLEKIFALPLFAVTGMQFDVIQDGCRIGVFEYIDANRAKFKGQVQAYYNKKKAHLKWRQLDSNHLTPCYIKNNIKGLYE